MATIKIDEELQEKLNQFKKYEFEFENLVFEGGGAKMASYVGGIKVSLLKKISSHYGNSKRCVKVLVWFIKANLSTLWEFQKVC